MEHLDFAATALLVLLFIDRRLIVIPTALDHNHPAVLV